MKKSLPVLTLSLLAFVMVGCNGAGSPAVVSMSHALEKSYEEMVRPHAHLGISTRVERGELTEAEADVLRAELELHQLSIRALRGEDDG